MLQTIFLSRHGKTDENHQFDTMDVPNQIKEPHLIEEGVAQAERLGDYLCNEVPADEKVLFVVSSKVRTYETAEVVAGRMYRELADEYTITVIEPGLNEKVPLEFIVRCYWVDPCATALPERFPTRCNWCPNRVR